MAEDAALLPLTVVEGSVIFTGAFSPSRIDYEVKRLLASRWPGGERGQSRPLRLARAD